MVEFGKRLARRNTSTRNAGALNRYKQGVCKTSERNCSAERTQKRQVKKPSHRPPKGQSATQLFYLSSLRSPRGAASFKDLHIPSLYLFSAQAFLVLASSQPHDPSSITASDVQVPVTIPPHQVLRLRSSSTSNLQTKNSYLRWFVMCSEADDFFDELRLAHNIMEFLHLCTENFFG